MISIFIKRKKTVAILSFFLGVINGVRTHDPQNHNLML